MVRLFLAIRMYKSRLPSVRLGASNLGGITGGKMEGF